MKNQAFLLVRLILCIVLVYFIGPLVQLHVCAQAAELPTITGIGMDGTNIIVTVRAPSGLRQVTLECRERIGQGAWEPRAITRLDGSGGVVEFRLPRSRPVELMRVSAAATEPLPAAFYSGTNSFYEQSSVGANGEITAMAAGSLDSTTRATTQREVVESDIWKIREKTLYFFNELRGLQVIDITNPDSALVRATIELPASGEDMYLLGSNHVVLLARDNCGSEESEVVIVADKGSAVAVTARLAVPGTITESRLVGAALYVASQTYRPVPNSGGATWEWGTKISAFDLADPEVPIARGTLWYPGYGNVVTATDRWLFVVTQHPANWWQASVHTIDITAPDGTLRDHETIQLAGRVPDKFKLNWEDGVLTTISEDWRSSPGRTLTTRLETFRLPDPRSLGPLGVVKLGQLELGQGERLHATRFDAHRVYIVTFFQIDPLWVVDISNPTSPRIAGSVDVPGWSTFIQPLGDRLVSIGIESNHVAVSLFDVSNPTSPALVSRVRLGESYSWSEANVDEKAFNVLPDAGLILVPYSGDTTNGYASRVQLIDLHTNFLTARGVIEHRFQPRRAALRADRILSISGSEFLSVDAVDRDHPEVRGSLVLAWPADRVFVEGDFVLEIGGNSSWGWWGNEGKPSVRVARANAPNDLLTELPLTELPVLGATTQDGRLYIAQGQAGWNWTITANSDGTEGVPRYSLTLTVIDLQEMPSLRVLGRVEADVSSANWGSELQAVWPKPNVLVWVGGGNNLLWAQPYALTMVSDAMIARPWFPGSGVGGGQLIAFDVSNAAAPEFASEVSLMANDRWNFSKAFPAEGLVYLSHQTAEIAPEPLGSRVGRSYLNVVDYADARAPLARRPVNIPGTLNGISHRGAALYTIGTRWTTNTAAAWAEYLDASAYDGVSAHLIDSLTLPSSWPRPVLVAKTNIFIGCAAGSTGSNAATKPALETWFLSASGKLTRSGSVPLSASAQTVVAFEELLATQQTDNTTVLFDATEGAVLRAVGTSRPNGCFWFDLTRADGHLARGLWVPLGAYGIARIPAVP